MKVTTCIWALLAFLSLSSPAASQPTVTFTGGDNFVLLENDLVNGEWNVTVRLRGVPDGSLSIRAVNGTYPVRYIRIQAVSQPTLQGHILVSVTESGGTFPYIRRFESVPPPATAGPPGEVWLTNMTISGTIGDPGSPHTNYYSADILSSITSTNGNITANLYAGPRLFGGISTMVRVRAPAGSLLGHIVAPYGAIDNIEAGSNIGSGTNTVVLAADRGIKRIEANSIYAIIDTNYEDGPVDGFLRYLRARTGDLAGSVYCRALTSPNAEDGVFVAGNLNATFVCAGDAALPIEVTGSIPANERIVIGGSLDQSRGRISVAASGLQGLVTIGAAGSGSWGGPVQVGTTVLVPGANPPNEAPYYQVTSQALGGGAVGLVPFNLHREDCSPVHAGYRRLNQFSAANPIYATYYGELERAPGTGESLLATVEYHVPYSALDDSAGDWVPANACFTVDIDSANARRLKVTRGSLSPHPGLYRLKATADLRCKDVVGSPAVQDRPYWFWLALDCNGNGIADAGDFTEDEGLDCNRNGVEDCCDILLGGLPGDPDTCELEDGMCNGPCPCDWDGSGKLNSQDFFEFLNDFFDGNADFNNDNVTNSQDFFDFLNCFFAGCA